MSITFKLGLLAILAFVVLNSVITIIIGTVSWLLDKFGWKAWAGIAVIVAGLSYVVYTNFGDMIAKILIMIQ